MDAARNSEPRIARNTRRDVVDAALRLLDENGLPDLTMRRLAATLDVQPSALYWHFPNKQTLLAEVSDRIVELGVQEPSGASDWVDLTMAEAERLRQALLSHRDGAELVSSSVALGLGSGAPLSWLMTAIARGGFDPRTTEMAATALLHFVLGHVWHEQQRAQYERLAEGVSTLSDGAAFSFGVTLLVDGLRHLAPADAK